MATVVIKDYSLSRENAYDDMALSAEAQRRVRAIAAKKVIRLNIFSQEKVFAMYNVTEKDVRLQG